MVRQPFYMRQYLFRVSELGLDHSGQSYKNEKKLMIFKVLICKGEKLCYYNKDYVLLL